MCLSQIRGKAMLNPRAADATLVAVTTPHNYLQLRSRVDRFVDSILGRYREQIQCRAGCHACCAPGLTVVIVEAVLVGEALGISRERVFLQAGQPPLSEQGACALLDAAGDCAAYEHRPLTCRIQGLPLKYPDRADLSVCALNFVGAEPHPSAVFDVENLETALFAANLDFCQRAGLRPMSRVALDRLAELAGMPVARDL
jgi:hypothetical protein